MSSKQPTDAEILAGMLATFDGRLTELVSLMRGTVANQTLFSGTVKLDANGTWSNSWEVPFASVMVSARTAVTVDASSPKQSAPAQGIGVHKAKSGHWRMTGRELTVYGYAGALVTVIVTTDAPEHLVGVAASGTLTNPIGAGTTVISATPGDLSGWAFHETAGAAAKIYLYDGADATGTLMIPISLVANESTRDFPEGLSFSRLAAVIVSGAVEGSVFTRALT